MISCTRKDWSTISTPDIENELGLLLERIEGRECPVNLAKQFADTARKASCGKCVICREGILQIYLVVKDITEGNAREGDFELLLELTRNLIDLSQCSFGQTVGKLIKEKIQNETEVFEKHMKRKRCDALICKEYITIHILGEKCVGCSKCQSVCDHKAIVGKEQEIHVIQADNCNKCGACLTICPQKSIVKAGAVKPKTPSEPIPVGTFTAVQSGGGLMSRRRRR